jgi:hypothetical protein
MKTRISLICFFLSCILLFPSKGYTNFISNSDTLSYEFDFFPLDSTDTDCVPVLDEPYQPTLDSSLYKANDYFGDLIFSSIRNIYLTEQNRDIYFGNEYFYAGSPRFTLSGEIPNDRANINTQRALIMGTIVVAGTYVLHQKQNVAWWDGKERSFYIKEDGDYALYADKCGHFMGGYFLSYFARESFVYTGLSWDSSILFGSLFGLAVQSYVEVKDGFAENTGFSPSDFAADLGGVVFFYAQHRSKFLQNFSPKWQYTPPDWISVPPKARTHVFIDNYNATTAWLSIHVKNLVWGNKTSFWPKWLNIAVGYGISGYYTQEKYGRYVIGIDFNIIELLPDGPPIWNWIKQSLNCVKIPAPAFEVTRHGSSFKLAYPFTLSLGSLKF